MLSLSEGREDNKKKAVGIAKTIGGCCFLFVCSAPVGEMRELTNGRRENTLVYNY